MSSSVSFPSFAQPKSAQTNRSAQPDFKKSLSIEGQAKSDDAVQVKLGTASVSAATYNRKAKPAVQESDVAVRKEISAQVAVEEGKVEEKPSDVPPTFEGSYKDGTADFGGVTVKIGEGGEVEAAIKTPDGKEIRGKGVREKDGTTVVKFDNGQTYSARLTIDGDKAQISDLKLEERAEETKAESKDEDLSVAPS